MSPHPCCSRGACGLLFKRLCYGERERGASREERPVVVIKPLLLCNPSGESKGGHRSNFRPLHAPNSGCVPRRLHALDAIIIVENPTKRINIHRYEDLMLEN